MARRTRSCSEPIALDAGRIGNSAESSPGIRVFKGIPFAAPPVGALRWAAPQPVAKWDGVRDASKFGDVCLQAAGPTTGPGARLNIAVLPDSPPLSEDCLYLNVWTFCGERERAPPRHGVFLRRSVHGRLGLRAAV